MKPKLDFSLLTRPDSRSMFVSLPPELEKSIEPLTETSARIEGALKFCWYIGTNKDSLHSDDELKILRRREAFMRASLAEYVSIEDVIKRDLLRLGKIKKTEQPYKIINSENPMLHITRELRNLEIHLISSKISESKKDVFLRLNEGEKQIQTSIFTIGDLTVKKFKSLKFAKKRYSESEIKKMIQWFNEAQQDWGVNDIIFRSICEVTSEIVKKYSL